MQYAGDGSLRKCLPNLVEFDWSNKLDSLYNILVGLDTIHELDLVHSDLHDGNILICDWNTVMISDLGLCNPMEYYKSFMKDKVYGVLPFVASEVLEGKPYTWASDIYSFSMIMWEFTSGIPPFDDVPHDLNLCLNVCRGERPEIIEDTPQCYVDLMKKCWDENPSKRPDASEIMEIVHNWQVHIDLYYKKDRPMDINTLNEENLYEFIEENIDEIIDKIDDNQLKDVIKEFWKADKALLQRRANISTSLENNHLNPIKKSHQQAYKVSRLLDFTKDINNILERERKNKQKIESYELEILQDFGMYYFFSLNIIQFYGF